MIHDIWFVVLASMLVGYAILDGFDLGVGALLLLVSRNEADREATIQAIGPVWSGNEVWLIAAGGAMVVAFPHLYAASFSGFYLPLMMVLWLLILRGLGIEFRHQLPGELWRRALDVALCAASALLAILFGVAVANVLRGVPFDATGEFRGSFTLLLNPFAVAGGVLGLVVLMLHGATWLAHKTEGELQQRARRWAGGLWLPALAVLAGFTAASFVVRPDFPANFIAFPPLLLLPLLGLAAGLAIGPLVRRGQDRRAFFASALLVFGILASAAAGLYPRLLPALAGSAHPGLDIHNAAAPVSSMRIALGVYLVGMLIVAVYLQRIYRLWRGKVRAGEGYHG